MKIVVTGASGNAGTALLTALSAAHFVSDIVAVARRIPRRPPPASYNAATWVSVDVGGRSHPDTVAALVAAFSRADAVVHLAWAIQPSHDRDRLRRTNVLGTQRVLEAARQAGVAHVVVASSVGGYSPAHDDALHREDWPTGGIANSDYSVDKAHVESILDAHERDFPDTLITRLRPALIFQRTAGSQLRRYFAGPLVPLAIVRGRVPVLPWPAGLRLQAVHADDLAQAYVAALRRKPRGAINIAAADVLRAPQVAHVLAAGRWREVAHGAARAGVAAGWWARAIPIGTGWLDMGTYAPLMDTTHAQRILDWAPRVTATAAFAQLIEGMADGAGTASPPMRARRG